MNKYISDNRTILANIVAGYPIGVSLWLMPSEMLVQVLLLLVGGLLIIATLRNNNFLNTLLTQINSVAALIVCYGLETEVNMYYKALCTVIVVFFALFISDRLIRRL